MKRIDCSNGMETFRSSSTESPVLPVLLGVLNEFHRCDISYCYWKSSRCVSSALVGDNDMDLLVLPDHQHRAEAIILKRSFKLFTATANRDHPSILSFLGYDDECGRLVHLHLHLRLIIGEPLLKNYHLPWERFILDHAILHPGLPIRILNAATEALLIAVRACLELRRSDPVTVRRWRAATRKFASDRIDIARRVDPAALRETAAGLMNDELAEMIGEVIFGDQGLNGRRRLRRRIARHLASYRTYNAFEARLRSLARAMAWTAGNANKHALHLPRPWSRRAPGGGCVVAVVGVDGSGKSTVVAAVRAWLAPEIDVIPIYFGTGGGRPSLLMAPFKLMVPVVERMLKTKPRGASHGKVSDHPPGPLYGILLMIWATVVAWEKRTKLLAARRGADRGLVVVADRYPQNEIAGFNDGPLLTRLSRIPRRLRKFEAAAYALALRLPPDLVIKLDVRPETAARREPDMDPALIGERIADLQRLTFAAARVVRVDAEQPLSNVLRAVKREIWRLL